VTSRTESFETSTLAHCAPSQLTTHKHGKDADPYKESRLSGRAADPRCCDECGCDSAARPLLSSSELNPECSMRRRRSLTAHCFGGQYPRANSEQRRIWCGRSPVRQAERACRGVVQVRGHQRFTRIDAGRYVCRTFLETKLLPAVYA
jgi:hypothetical protein